MTLSGVFFPIKHDDGLTDKRYSIGLEYNGARDPLYVLRFCGDYIESFVTQDMATIGAKNLRARHCEAMGIAGITESKGVA